MNKKENKFFSNKELKNKIKELLTKAKNKGLIKSYKLAFDDTPDTEEDQNSQSKSYKFKINMVIK